MTRGKVLFIYNSPAPYFLDFLDELGNYVEFKVVFLGEKITNNPWKIGNNNNFVICSPERKWLSIREAFDDFKPDVCVFGGYRNPYFWLLSLMCLVRSTKTFYWMERPINTTVIHSALRYCLLSLVLKPASGLLCIGNEALSYYRKFRKKCINLPYSINVGAYSIRGGGRKTEKPIRFLYLGQFSNRKGVVELVDAFKSLPNADANLTLIGTGELLPLLEQKICGTNNISVLDFADNEFLKQNLCKHDVLVMPTRHDGWGVVIAEAMAAGLAVISTRDCSAANDLLFSQGIGQACNVNVVSISNAMRRYIDKPFLIDKESEHARKIVRNANANSSGAVKVFLSAIL